MVVQMAKTSHARDVGQRSRILASEAKARGDLDRMNPDLNWGMGVARVVNIDYEAFTATLRTIIGTAGQYERVPVPISFPGAGMRHFFGALPEIGDMCVVGWLPQESSETGGGTKTPVILAWVLPGTSFARHWTTVASFDPDEFDMSSERAKTMTEGAHAMVRMKMRHMHPGNVLASSSQGSDLVLDEGVMLANRRGNEIRLRDQDQALVLRSLQQFHAMAGARVYAGMVQRDATFLPKTMVSDGTHWDDVNQSLDGEPFHVSDNETNEQAPRGFLSPTALLARSRLADGKSRPTILSGGALDPYVFLANGGFISETGFVVDAKHDPSGYYGGKSIYRVASDGKSNAVTAAGQRTFTEYRIEVNHTSDGILPVTEQTDLFDADRLPGSNPNADPVTPPSNVPFMEFVMGSVVGNDPYSQEGRKKYGVPLVARIFEGDMPVPRLDGADLNGGTPVGDQLASLFRMIPPVGNTESQGTFWGVNKSGQFRASIGGKPSGLSAEIAMSGSLKIGLGGGMRFISDGHLEWVTNNKSSLNISASEGSVQIYGGGPPKNNSAVGERNNGTDGGEGDLPSVDILARTSARIKAERLVAIKAGAATINAANVGITSHGDLTLDGAARVSISTDTYQMHSNGKAQESFGGPKYGMPTNMPLHERTYTPSYAGVAERVLYTLGDREEQFNAGSHKTTILIGNMTYETNLGSWTARAMASKIEIGTSGISGTAQAGSLSMTAAAGMATVSGTAGVAVVSTGGQAAIMGGAGVYFGGPITEIGSIIVSGSLEPFTGLPYSTWGIGAKSFNIGGFK